MQLHDVIGFVYQYIKLLHQSTPQEWIFKELQDIGNMEFRFAEEQPQDDYAAELAGFPFIMSSIPVIKFIVNELNLVITGKVRRC